MSRPTSNPPRVAIVDYGAGNLASLSAAFRQAGAEPTVTHDAEALATAHALVLPGVGAFATAIGFLQSHGLDDFIKAWAASHRPLLGICLGMQLLFDESTEHGRHAGLGIIPGSVVRLEPPPDVAAHFKVPHTAWNRVRARGHGALMYGDEHYYFMHSYYAAPKAADVCAATTEYGGIEFCCAIESENVFGVQFHPERSGSAGIAFLRRFVHLVSARAEAREAVPC